MAKRGQEKGLIMDAARHCSLPMKIDMEREELVSLSCSITSVLKEMLLYVRRS